MEKAVECYLKAANLGYADAQAALGYLYKNGSGVPRDPAKSFEFSMKAARQNLLRGLNDVGP